MKVLKTLFISILLLFGGTLLAIPAEMEERVLNITSYFDEENYGLLLSDGFEHSVLSESSYFGAEELDDGLTAPCVFFRNNRGYSLLVNICGSCRIAHLRHHPSGKTKSERLNPLRSITYPRGTPNNYWKITRESICRY